jgi:hypothetical protein
MLNDCSLKKAEPPDVFVGLQGACRCNRLNGHSELRFSDPRNPIHPE